MAKNLARRYLIDIGHPAHVHYYKNFARTSMKSGHEVLFTCRNKDISISLLKQYEFKYICFGRPFTTLIGKLFGLIYFTFRIFVVSIRFKPDIFLNSSLYSAIVAWISGKPHISLEDTFNMEQVSLYSKFTTCILTGDYEHMDLGKKEIRYKSYQELLYLHPSNFTPDQSVLEELGLKSTEPFVIIRFVSWKASHDIGHKGISLENKIAAVNTFSKYARVFISSETPLPLDLQQYSFSLPAHRMHHAMAFSSLIYGESATMVSEGAVLGIPGIYLDNSGRSYTNEQETKYGLVFNYTESESDQLLSISKGRELLSNSKNREVWQEKRIRMLTEKINAASFLNWFVSKYPDSIKIMKDNSDYQNRFK